MNNQSGLRSGACVWIGLYTIVIHPKLRELGHELDEIEKAPCVSLTNSFLRNVVPTSHDPRMHARYVQVGVSETDIPDAHLDSRLHGLFQKRRDRSSAKGRLKSIVKAFVDRSFEQASALVPRCALCFLECDARIRNAY